jgi:hypothetical protein
LDSNPPAPAAPSAGAPAPAAPAAAAPATAAEVDRQAFATQVLTGLGMPVTSANVNFLIAWMQREGGGGANNPLNTTLQYGGSTSLAGNSAGVQNYASAAIGVQATIQTLQSAAYGDIRAALKTGKADPNQTYNGLSTWSGGGYNTLSGIEPVNMQVSSSAGTGSGGSAFGAPPATTVNAQELEAQYGATDAFFKSVPELEGIVSQAVAGQWDEARFKAAVQNSAWYKNHNNAFRQWYQLGIENPAEADRQRQQTERQIGNLAQQYGINMPAGDITWLANTSLAAGWNDAQIEHALGGMVKGLGGSQVAAQNLGEMAKQYLVPLSPQALQAWEQSYVQTGQTGTTFDQFRSYLVQQAKSMYPGAAGALDSGITMQQYADPYAQLAAQTLQIPPNEVDFTQPKWQKALMQIDPKTGQRQSMNLSDWTSLLKTDPVYGYDTTQNARNDAADLANKIMTSFGFGGSMA